MKITTKIACTASLLFAAFAFGENAVNTKKLKEVVLPEGFTFTAHTGCEKTKDNSLDAITVGFGYGADIVEFDLNFNEEGIAVLSHDKPKGDCFTLDEAFSLISGYKGLKANVDVKSAADLGQVIACAEKYNLTDRIFFTGVEREKVPFVQKDAEGYVYFLNTDIDSMKKNDPVYITELMNEVKKLGACGINISYRKCTEEMVRIFHENSLLVSVWTVNKTADMKKMLIMGVDNITTRKVSQLKTILDLIRG